ncbi:hypothetical protein IRZ80_04595 [Flavobacterium sp. HJJ]|nr:hypothetical protein [Flavobacterium sp. HJJ]
MKMLILTAAIILRCAAIYADRYTKIQSDIESQYTEVSVNTVPATIKAALEKAYSGTKLIKTYVNQKKEYKLELSVNNQKATVYTDVNGNR